MVTVRLNRLKVSVKVYVRISIYYINYDFAIFTENIYSFTAWNIFVLCC